MADYTRLTNLEVTGDLRAGLFTGPTSQIVKGTPVNAIAAKVELAAAVVGLISNGDTVVFEGSTFTKVASGATAGEFTNAAGLAALFDALAAWDGGESAGKVTVTAATKGVAANGKTVAINILAGTTAGGGVSAQSTVTLAAADLAQFANGDTVKFEGQTFTKAATTNVSNKKFADTAGLKDCLDAMTGWGAVVSTADIVITAAEDGDNDGKDVDIQLKRATATGVDGTVGAEGDVMWDASYIYVCTGDNTIADANWKSAALS